MFQSKAVVDDMVAYNNASIDVVMIRQEFEQAIQSCYAGKMTMAKLGLARSAGKKLHQALATEERLRQRELIHTAAQHIADYIKTGKGN